MIRSTETQREHYAKLVGRTVLRIQWDDREGQALPVLIFRGRGRDGQSAYAAVLTDPEGNGPGHLDHNIKSDQMFRD